MKRILLGIIIANLFLPLNIKAQNNQSEIEAKIDQIISELSLKEKVDMCHAQSKFSSPGVPRLGIPEIWMSDGPHGVRSEISWDSWDYAAWTNDSITAFPALTCLAAAFNPELSFQYGIAVGEEARYRKKDILLGPGVNIYRTPLNGRNFEYMGEDPFLASTLVVPYIKGVQENGVAACVKHYVLNNQEKWRNIIDVSVSDRALHEIYLPAFKAAVVEGNVWSVMGAYNKYKGQFCCHNEELLINILKKDWGFDGVVVSDWGATHDSKEAALYGLDIEMGTGTDGLTSSSENAYNYYYLANPFLKMLEEETIDEEVLDEKVRRILRLMYRSNMNKNRPLGRMNNIEHLQVAREVGREGIVLLKNEDKFFPIDSLAKITIAVIGENAIRPMTTGGGSSELKAKNEISPLEGLRKKFKNARIHYAKGYESGPSAYGVEIPSKTDPEPLRKAAIELASSADIVLYFGGLNKNHHQDCEGGDRKNMGLPFGQDELISEILKVNKNVGMILISGNAVAMPWISNIKGLMQAWYLGSEAGNAIANVISGETNPSGKLPFSFPVKLSDNSAHYFGELSYPGDGKNQYYKEDILVGYRWHDFKNIKPLFAFGYGLSYTTFEIKNAKTDKKSYSAGETIKLTCDISNTGNVDGKEVVQIYVGKPNSKIKRAEKELKAFKKVFIEKGNKRQIQLSIELDNLSFYDVLNSSWSLEKGAYVIYVGNASNQIFEKLSISIN